MATSNPKIFAQQMVANVDRYVARLTRGSKQAVRWGAEMILEHTLPLVPMDTGALRSSGRVSNSTGETDSRYRVSSMVKFGGGRVHYAVYVHEINKNYRVGQWKYLQEGVNRARPQLTRGITERLKAIRAK